jgi:hypothetical protein
MARGFTVYGEVMVYVTGAIFDNTLVELGLCTDSIQIAPRIKNREIMTDDFGDEVPAEVMAKMTDALVTMTLIHYDEETLSDCVRQSMGGVQLGSNPDWQDGVCGPTGRTMGGGVPLGYFGNRYVTLYLMSAVDARPWRFPATYILDGYDYPVGSKASEVQLTFRAIPYISPVDENGNVVEILSDGAIVWDHVDLFAQEEESGDTVLQEDDLPPPVKDNGSTRYELEFGGPTLG